MERDRLVISSEKASNIEICYPMLINLVLRTKTFFFISEHYFRRALHFVEMYLRWTIPLLKMLDLKGVELNKWFKNVSYACTEVRFLHWNIRPFSFNRLVQRKQPYMQQQQPDDHDGPSSYGNDLQTDVLRLTTTTIATATTKNISSSCCYQWVQITEMKLKYIVKIIENKARLQSS